MPVSELMRMVNDGDLAAFEKTCLEALESGTVELEQLVQPFQALEKKADASRIAGLSELVLDNVDLEQNPVAALGIARIALMADAENLPLRKRVAELYRRVHGQTPGFDRLIETSGLEAGRPARNALRMLDLCLTIRKGEPLLSRSESVCVEVVDVDFEHGIVTVRSEGRPRSVPVGELSREYERISPDDYRAMRQLRPDELRQRLQNDPATVVIELIRLHGGMLDQETLKHEVCPRFIAPGAWTKWWSSLRAALKRNPHVILEGRSPVILSYTEAALTFEDETWADFEASNDPHDWLTSVETYLREKKRRRETPDAALAARMHAHLTRKAHAAVPRRPIEALACALVADRLHAETGVVGDEAKDLASGLLREVTDPGALIAQLNEPGLWEIALDVLTSARPDDAAAYAVEVMSDAPAGVIDRIVAMGLEAGLAEAIQAHIGMAVADPVDHTEIVYWLWRGPAAADRLTLPPPTELFTTIIGTLSALGRSLTPPPAVMKQFRQRMKAALGLQDFAAVRRCIESVDALRAVTLRTQLERLEGLGDNTRGRLLDILRDVHPALWQVRRERRQPWADPDILWTTEAGLARKVEERDNLVNVAMRENARKIGEAASHGDLSENSEYKFALEERDLLRARLAQMNQEISLAERINPADVPTEHIGVGSRAVLRDTANGAVHTFVFLGPFDGDVERGIYNYSAPFSQKLMGATLGERRRVPFDGRETEFEVLEITNGLAGG